MAALKAATREMAARGRSVALAVDGPRGPARTVQAGAAALSAFTGRPVVCTVVACRWALALPSWDGMMIPLPLARVEVRYRLLEAPGRSREEVEHHTLRLGQRLLELELPRERPKFRLRGRRGRRGG